MNVKTKISELQTLEARDYGIIIPWRAGQVPDASSIFKYTPS